MNNLTKKEKSQLLVAATTFETKGINDKFISIKVSDGPAGLRMPTDEFPAGKPTYCLPCVSLLANTFNEDVLYNVGQVLASQCINENVDIILAPGINIKRTPLCGRNFEYFSEDPYLTGVLASSYVNGIQSKNIGVSLKHFCCNNREFDRLYQSSDVDYRTLREVYTKAFEMVIKDANPYTIMCSYNPVNGINVAENKFILNDVLRDKLHFENVLISDWGAVHNRVDSLKASLDIQFPYDEVQIKKLQRALNKPEIERLADDSLKRIEKLCEKVKYNKEHKQEPLSNEKVEEICINAIAQGSVLLKNKNNILPLKGKNIAIIGDFAYNPLYCGGGSAMIYLNHKFNSLMDELKAINNRKNYEYSRMYYYGSCTFYTGGIATVNSKEAYDLASRSDDVVMIVGTNHFIETESYDRESLKLPDSLELAILEVAKRNKNVVVVIQSGGVIDTSNWINEVKGVLHVGYGGSYTNKALAKLLLGKENPSGRLAETYPLDVLDTPTKLYKGDGIKDEYKEKLLVGYKWYDYHNLEVMFPFGYGLSYSKFSYDNINIKENNLFDFTISLDINNTSKNDGYETIQVYLSNKSSKLFQVNKQLVKFKKVFVKAKESISCEIRIDEDCFKYFNPEKDKWIVNKGKYLIHVAKDSKNIIKTFEVNI